MSRGEGMVADRVLGFITLAVEIYIGTIRSTAIWRINNFFSSDVIVDSWFIVIFNFQDVRTTEPPPDTALRPLALANTGNGNSSTTLYIYIYIIVLVAAAAAAAPDASMHIHYTYIIIYWIR